MFFLVVWWGGSPPCLLDYICTHLLCSFSVCKGAQWLCYIKKNSIVSFVLIILLVIRIARLPLEKNVTNPLLFAARTQFYNLTAVRIR